MSTRFHRLACPTILAALAFAGWIMLTNTAAAWYTLGGKHSAGEIAAKCASAGGAFDNDGDSYGCATDGGAVSCNAKTQVCRGNCSNCPKIKGRPVATVGGVLHGSAGAASGAGGGVGTKRINPVNNAGGLKLSGGTAAGANHPVVLERGGGHSGGSKH
jgi:hypothetical protein